MIIFAYPKGKTQGMSAFVVDSKSEGFSVAMHLEEKIGLFTSDTAMLELSNVRIPKENLLGQPGRNLVGGSKFEIHGSLDDGQAYFDLGLEAVWREYFHGLQVGKAWGDFFGAEEKIPHGLSRRRSFE